MQATETFSGSAISKRAAAIVAALLAASVLGGAGVLVAKSATAGQANPHVNAAPAAVPQSVIGSDSYRSVRGGLQLGDGAAPTVQSRSGSGAGDACMWVNRRKAC
jgi:hypothetical protein